MENYLTRDEDILKYYGWEIECQSPYELRNIDGSFATGQAAYMVMDYLRQEYIIEKYEDLMSDMRELGVKNKILKEVNK